jgi:hypothetical protein
MRISAEDYLTNADNTLARADHFGEIDKARLTVAEAQVFALQAIASAIDRLAAAVEETTSGS